MFGLFGGKKAAKKSDFEIEDDHDEEQESEFLRSLQVNLSRLIAYCESAEVTLQREVAEKLANEAVKPARQVQIVQYGGLKLLVPLTKSTDMEVQRLAAHALANLSVNSDNQRLMADEDAIDCLITLLDSQSDLIQRQAAKALANLGVNNDNKAKIATAGGLVKLLDLAGSKLVSVRIEAVAAVANLAVNDNNEVEIVRLGVDPIVQGAELAADGLYNPGARTEKEITQLEELATQCCRALRNLSVNPDNKARILTQGALYPLQTLSNYHSERIGSQARRALRNLQGGSGK
eukprot:gene3129-2302_t